jgi:cytochrome c2
MGFGGIEDETERAAVLAYLRSLSDDPEPLGGPRDEGRAAAIEAGLAPIAFTGEQVAAGRDFANRYCARCHGTNYRGTTDMREFGEAPGIVGPLFEARWFGRPVGDLYTLFATDPRDDHHGGLTPERYVNVIAFMAERNGLVPGDVPLPVDEAALAGIGFYQ